MTTNSNPSLENAGVVDAFLKVLSENIKVSGTVENELKNIVKLLDQQQKGISDANKELTAIRVEFSQTTRAVETLKEVTADHEQRIRSYSEKLAGCEQTRERVRALETDLAAHKAAQEATNEKQDEKLQRSEIQYTRILAIGGALIMVTQAVISLFIAPLVQKALF